MFIEGSRRFNRVLLYLK